VIDRSTALLFLLVGAGFAACAKGAATTDDVPEGGSPDAPFTSDGGGGGDGGAVEDGGVPVEEGGGGPATKAGPGDVVISEIMYDPSGTEPDGEWIEIYNTTSSPKLLGGLTLEDNASPSHTTTIAASANVEVPAKGYLLLVNSRSAAAANGLPGASSAYEYFTAPTGPLLANSAAASIALRSGATTLCEIGFGGFSFGLPAGGGASIELKTLTAAASSSKASWCIATNAWASGDKGTPGKANDCP
jgi:Lamin Tail Domain